MNAPKPRMLDTDDVVRQMRADANPDHLTHTVTAAQLRAALANCPDDAIIVLSKGPGTGDYSPLAVDCDGQPRVEDVLYYPHSTWHGDVDTAENEASPGALFAVLLNPIN